MKNKPDFDIEGIGAILKRGKLWVPPHQRDYYWTLDQVTAMLDDYKDGVDYGAGHFLGQIVLRRDDDGFEVVDGQQRLSTTTMILAAIRDVHYGRKEQIQMNSIEHEFLLRTDRKTEEVASLLKLNIRDQGFFMRAVVRNPADAERVRDEPLGSSNQKLLKAALEIRRRVEEMLKATPAASQKAYLQNWVNFIEDKATVLMLTVDSEENAYALFETLNARGARVSEEDLVKSHVFKIAAKSDDPQRLNHLVVKWNSVVTLVESLGQNEDFLDFLRIACSVKYQLVKARDLFKKIKAEVQTPVGADKFVHELEEFATAYVAMLSPSHPKWNSYPPSIRRALRTLAVFDVMQVRYVMLAVALSFNEHQATQAFQTMVNWIVRFLIAGTDRIGRLDKKYAVLAHQIYRKEITTCSNMVAEIKPELADNVEFMDAFAKAVVSKAKLARYYLDSMERKSTEGDDAGLVPDDDTLKVNLEHIVPIGGGDGWTHIDEEIRSSLFNRLGNMVLLNSKKNAKLGNVSFEKKRTAFAESPFVLTRTVTDCASWGLDEINARQKKLAELAVKTWPLD